MEALFDSPEGPGSALHRCNWAYDWYRKELRALADHKYFGE